MSQGCSCGPGNSGCPGLATTEGFLTAKGSHTLYTCPPWNPQPQPADPAHGLRGLEKVGREAPEASFSHIPEGRPQRPGLGGAQKVLEGHASTEGWHCLVQQRS